MSGQLIHGGTGIPIEIALITSHLKAYMGDLAEQFIARELIKINKDYVDFDPVLNGYQLNLHHQPVHLRNGELDRLLRNIQESLLFIVGPNHSRTVVKRIKTELQL